jgi:predicted nucleic acid-binding protein
MLLEKCHLQPQLLQLGKLCTIFAPERVMEEYSIGDGQISQPDTRIFRQVFFPAKVNLDEELLPYFNYESTSGEIWVMSYARHHPEFTCVIDEAFARNLCNLLGVKVIGTIGIIREMKTFGLLTTSDLGCVRESIRKSRFYLSRELLRQLDEICDVP